MNEFELLGKVHTVIDEYVNSKIGEWFESNNVNYRLVYPLVAVELGAMNESPESMNNLLKRGATGFLYSKALELDKEITLKRFDTVGLSRYLAQYETIVEPLYQNYRFSKEINDINPITKARIKKISEHRYQLTTSLVSDKYNEEYFYFYGVDDIDNNKKEATQIFDLHRRFHEKIFIEQITIKNLINNIDNSLYNLCVQAVNKDLNKWNSNVKSSIFSHPHQLALVIGYFYYYAVLKSIELRILKEHTDNLIDIGKQCILNFSKDKCIQDIALLSGLRRDKVEKIVEYLINKGNANILEFPLFEIEEQLITIPSLILVNDWQFSIINGHYAKGIIITNREKTISTVSEERIENVLQGITNIAVAKRKDYSFIDENGQNQNSDIDYAIYDIKSNIILVIEAKWIDNHYLDEVDKRYGKIFQTLNKIYSKQIEKHKKFLTSEDNINYLFNEDERYIRNHIKPKIYYLAVDKRNQMHIGDKHLISEFMLIAFLKGCIIGNTLDIGAFWKKISMLQTKVEYIVISDEFYEISIGEDTVLIEKDDLYWE